MKRKRFSVEQIVAAVKQHDLGVSEQTFYRWKKQNGRCLRSLILLRRKRFDG